MSKVIKETGYRLLSHVVQTNDGSFYMVESNDTFDHGYETMGDMGIVHSTSIV